MVEDTKDKILTEILKAVVNYPFIVAMEGMRFA